MTLAAQDHEIWTPEDGAPGGVAFQVKVASKSEADLTYTIARDEQGVIYHVHACPRWRFAKGTVGGQDRRMCRHVKEALALAESPELTFIERMVARYKQIGGAMATGDDLHRFWTETHADGIAAREIRLTQLGVFKAKAEWSAKTPDEQITEAVATFDRGPLGAAR